MTNTKNLWSPDVENASRKLQRVLDYLGHELGSQDVADEADLAAFAVVKQAKWELERS